MHIVCVLLRDESLIIGGAIMENLSIEDSGFRIQNMMPYIGYIEDNIQSIDMKKLPLFYSLSLYLA